MITYSKIAVGNVQRCMCYGKKHIRDSNLLPFKTQNNYGDKLVIIKMNNGKQTTSNRRKRSIDPVRGLRDNLANVMHQKIRWYGQ